MKLIKTVCALLFLCSCTQSFAQFLPDNTTLNVQSVQRWMASNRDFSTIMQTLDGMHASEDDLKRFEALPAAEQDQKIAGFLQKNNLLHSTMTITAQHGWKSPGEYMRFSTRLGNAIAAYFFTLQMANLTEDQKKSVRAKTDAAVLNVSAEDIAFVKSNETLLKAYMQGYSKGH